MSTILDALQKQKFLRGDYVSQHATSEKGLLKWRVALLTALLIIIGLLTLLLYKQFSGQENGFNREQLQAENKAGEVTQTAERGDNGRVVETVQRESKPVNASLLQSVPAEPEPVNASLLESGPAESEAVSDSLLQTTQTESNTVKKVTFVTQPLPAYQADTGTAVLSDNAAPAGRADPSVNGNGEEELDYRAVSDDLRQRFELALLSNPEQEPLSLTATGNDGSDIYEMSSEFQKKVPSIRYDTHIYSTIARERWIKVNGEKLKEGQFDGQGQIQLLEIQPNRSIFRLGRQSFSLESLTDWKGY
ncbi:MAG TPA: general secretion pathway protein GspB [Psychromonas sp.]